MATAGGIQSDDEEPQSKDERKKLLVAVNEIKGLGVLSQSRDTKESLVAHGEDGETVISNILLSGFSRLGPIKYQVMVSVFSGFTTDFVR